MADQILAAAQILGWAVFVVASPTPTPSASPTPTAIIPPSPSPSASPTPSPNTTSSTPAITLNQPDGLPGTQFTLKGKGYPPGEAIVFYFDDHIGDCGSPPMYVDAQGEFAHLCTVPVGYLAFGAHVLCGNTQDPTIGPQPVQASACAHFVIDVPTGPPDLALSIHHGIPGTRFTVTGSRFASSTSYAIYLDSRGASCDPSVTSDAQGGFAASCMLPWQANPQTGAHTVCADKADLGTAAQSPPMPVCVPMQMDALGPPTLIIGKSYALPNSAGLVSVDITVTGLPPGEIVAVYDENRAFWCGIPELTPAVGAQGVFSERCGASSGVHRLCADTGFVSSQAIAVVVCTEYTADPALFPSPAATPTAPPSAQAVNLVSNSLPPKSGMDLVAARRPESVAIFVVALMIVLACGGMWLWRSRRTGRSLPPR